MAWIGVAVEMMRRVRCWMYFEGRVQCVGIKKREVKDGSKTYSVGNWKDGVTFN